MRVRRSHAVALLLLAALVTGLLGPFPHAPTVQPAPAPLASARVTEPSQASPDEADEAAPPGVDPSPSAASRVDRTTIAVLRVGRGGGRVELVSWATKPIPFTLSADDAAPTAATYVLEDARTGERLASGPCALPRLCPCPGTRDHRQGCLRLRHEAVVRVKLPRVAAAERLTIVGPDEVPLATFALEGA